MDPRTGQMAQVGGEELLESLSDLARRENVARFETPEQAAAAGFKQLTEEEARTVSTMNRKQRRAWAKQNRLKERK